MLYSNVSVALSIPLKSWEPLPDQEHHQQHKLADDVPGFL
jgi:hypothetical protein